MPNRLLRDTTYSEKIDGLSCQAERFFYRLIMKVDDFGCFSADPRLLKSACFPLIVDNRVTVDQITAWIQELTVATIIISYEHVGKPYLQILDFGQKLDRMVSRHPTPGNQNHIQSGYVYLMGHENEATFKIGFSANPWARVREANSKANALVVLRACYKGTTDDEKMMHDLLRKFTTNGKIYTLPAEIIKALSTSYEQKMTAEQTFVVLRSNSVVLRSSLEVEVESEVENKLEAPNGAASNSKNFSSPPEQPVDNSGTPPKRKRIAGAEKIKFVPPTEQEAIDYFTKRCYVPKNPGTWFPDKCRSEAIDFVNFYNANGWKQGSKGSGKPIVSWTAAANMWISRAKKGEFAPITHSTPAAPMQSKEQQVHRERAKELPAVQRDINYLYEKYLEAPDMITEKSMSAPDYDYLKQGKLIDFDQAKRTAIRTKALEKLKPITETPEEAMVLQMMKKIGVLEAFAEFKQRGMKIIYQ